MTVTEKWAADWSVCKENRHLSERLIPVFEAFLDDLIEKGVSKATFRRHKSACHALGGHIVSDPMGLQTAFVATTCLFKPVP